MYSANIYSHLSVILHNIESKQAKTCCNAIGKTRGMELGGKVGLITRAPMGEGALERPEIKMLFLFYFFISK